VALETALKVLDALEGEATLLRDPEAWEALHALDGVLAAGGDVILYLASHGLTAPGANEVFRLATGETHDVMDGEGAFVVADAIDRIAGSGPGRRLLIIDAPYRGRPVEALDEENVTLDLPDDLCLLFSTDPFNPGQQPKVDVLTAFTGDLTSVLFQGIEGRGPELSLRAIYAHLRAVAEASEQPLPGLLSNGKVAETITFKNAAPDELADDDGGADHGERVVAFEHRTEILYVDDQEQYRVDFRRELERAGHRVTLSTGPVDGAVALASGHFDIVVIDLLLVGDVPATDFIRECSRAARDSLIFLASRPSKGDEKELDLYPRLDSIFAYPSRVAAFLWKPNYLKTIEAHANRIRDTRLHTLARIDGLDESVPLVAERMIKRDRELGERSERLQLEIRVCVERLTEKWFPRESNERVYIERMVMRAIDGGRSSSSVFTLRPKLRGVDAKSVTPLVLKLGPRDEIDEEVRRYDCYVQVGVPLDFRTDRIASSLVGGVGGIIYSFRGDPDSVQEVSQLEVDEIEKCFDAVFASGQKKRWYAAEGTGEGMLPLDHYEGIGFPGTRFRSAFKEIAASHAKAVAATPPDSLARAESLVPAWEAMTSSHGTTLVHGDLTLENLIRVDDGRYAIIDYRTVGLGPRLVDFATLEIACWLLAEAPATTRADRFLDAREAVPRRLRDPDRDRPVAEWLANPRRLALKCRELALNNHKDATDREYGSLLWLAAVRSFEFRAAAPTTAERNARRALLPALAMAAQEMMTEGAH
jgi:CheY-like chemotaxis protein